MVKGFETLFTDDMIAGTQIGLNSNCDNCDDCDCHDCDFNCEECDNCDCDTSDD